MLDNFLKENTIWEGTFTNYVNRKGGIVQEGKMRVKVTINDEGIISHENAFFDKEGNPGPYTGSMKIKAEGDKLINMLEIKRDPNTGTEILNHRFDGYIGKNHIHILEEYDDKFPDGKIDHRRNSVHYYFVTEEHFIMISDVYVNGELLVFANSSMHMLSE